MIAIPYQPAPIQRYWIGTARKAQPARGGRRARREQRQVLLQRPEAGEGQQRQRGPAVQQDRTDEDRRHDPPRRGPSHQLRGQRGRHAAPDRQHRALATTSTARTATVTRQIGLSRRTPQARPPPPQPRGAAAAIAPRARFQQVAASRASRSRRTGAAPARDRPQADCQCQRADRERAVALAEGAVVAARPPAAARAGRSARSARPAREEHRQRRDPGDTGRDPRQRR